MKDLLKKVFEKYDIELNETQLSQFEKYYNFLIEENEKFNLTAITKEDEVIYKHFLDSVLPYKKIKQGASLLDIGSGAGFPGIPLKILRPDLKIVLLDSLQKRVNFLNQTINLLNLKKIEAVHSRAEDYASKNREKFDYVVSRAVAQTNTLSEYMLPFLKIGGKALLYKSTKLDEELLESQKTIEILGGKIEKVEEYSISDIDSLRKLLIISKIKTTPSKYPRGKNLPKTKPIM